MLFNKRKQLDGRETKAFEYLEAVYQEIMSMEDSLRKDFLSLSYAKASFTEYDVLIELRNRPYNGIGEEAIRTANCLCIELILFEDRICEPHEAVKLDNLIAMKRALA